MVNYVEIPNIGRGVKIPGVGTLALAPLPACNDEPTPLNLHKQVGRLSQINKTDYSILTPDHYPEVLKYARQNSPELEKSLMDYDDVLNARLFLENQRGRMHSGFRLDEESGLWKMLDFVDNPITDIHDDISYHSDGLGDGGVFAITNGDKQKEFFCSPWEHYISNWPINHAVRVLIPE